MSCTICNQNTCGCNSIAQAKGDPGQPAFLNMSFMVGGYPFSDNTNAWVEVGRMIFSKDVADLFTSLRLNIWRAGGSTVNWRIIRFGSVTPITSGNVTSTKKPTCLY